MQVEKYNDYWIATDVYLPQEKRNENAELIYQYLSNLGWTKNAIAGILGNMDVESTMNPALIEGRGTHTLIDNFRCLEIGGTIGVGLVQWTGNTDTPPAGQKLASFAIRYNMQWFDGECQCYRLERECATNIQFDPGTVDGVYYDWQTYIASTETPEQLAKVWQFQYERGGTDTQTRQQKARYYYNSVGHTQIPWLYFVMSKQRKVGKKRCLTI